MGHRRATKGPTRESIERALVHHTIGGAIKHWSPPGGGRSTWVVVLHSDTVELTTPKAWALCVGLAAGEQAYRTREGAR